MIKNNISTGTTMSKKNAHSLIVCLLGGMMSASAVAVDYEDPQTWMDVYGSKTDMNDIDDIRGRGFVMGVDAKFAPNLVLGSAFSVSENKVDDTDVVGGTRTDLESHTYQGILYALKTLNRNTFLKATGVLGLSENDSERAIAGNQAHADFNSWFANVNAELGRSFEINENAALTPSFLVNYTYLSSESYNEKGSPLVAVRTEARDDDALDFGLKVSARYKIMTLRLATSYDVLSDQSSLQSRIISTGNQFTTNAASINEGFVFKGGVGVEVLKNEKWSGSMNYDFVNGDDADSQILSALVSYKF